MRLPPSLLASYLYPALRPGRRVRRRGGVTADKRSVESPSGPGAQNILRGRAPVSWGQGGGPNLDSRARWRGLEGFVGAASLGGLMCN